MQPANVGKLILPVENSGENSNPIAVVLEKQELLSLHFSLMS